MPNLVEQLGLEYVDQFYKNAYFQIDDRIYMYGRHRAVGVIGVHAMSLDGPDKGWSSAQLRDDAIESMDTFAWPRLGYRQLDVEDLGPLVYYIHTARSAMRGLKDDFIVFTPIPIVALQQEKQNPRDFLSSSKYVKEIFKPTFTPFLDGMEAIRSGESMGFAMSPDVAVGISVDQAPGREVDVYYRRNVVGEVLSDNTVKIPSKIAKRMHGSNLFRGHIL